MLPIRCFSCNKILGCYNHIFGKWKQESDNFLDFFEKYDIKRYCCRKIFLTNIDICQYDPQMEYDNIICKKNSEIKKILKAE
jgi:DNA-directed RNA polymerase subunit N (RpoN/RPB10)